jgi:cell wall-associated NlpC family hydrolase
VAFGCSSHHPDIPGTHIPPASGQTKEYPDQLETLSGERKTVVSHAIKSVGTPYTWGGESPGQGFDCSGLVMYTHSMAGVPLPRTARAQFKKGRAVTTLSPGDLVFFNAPDKKDSFHVGIFIGQNIFIHAPGKGRTVTRSTLTNPYFKRYFKGGRTFL